MTGLRALILLAAALQHARSMPFGFGDIVVGRSRFPDLLRTFGPATVSDNHRDASRHVLSVCYQGADSTILLVWSNEIDSSDQTISGFVMASHPKALAAARRASAGTDSGLPDIEWPAPCAGSALVSRRLRARLPFSLHLSDPIRRVLDGPGKAFHRLRSGAEMLQVLEFGDYSTVRWVLVLESQGAIQSVLVEEGTST